MKKTVISTLLISFILTSCSIDWNDAKEKRISELEKQVQEMKNTVPSITGSGASAFEKRTRCAALGPDIEKRIISMQSEYKELGTFSLGGIFYSPVKDACLWIRLTATVSKDGSPMEHRSLYVFGDDSGAATPIIGCDKILSDTKGVDACEAWDSEIKRLKGEDTGNVLVP